jgi:hypothetical protein
LDLIYWGFLPYSSYGISGIFEDNPSLQIPLEQIVKMSVKNHPQTIKLSRPEIPDIYEI